MKTLKEIYAYRHMIASLVRRDLRGRYKASVLGFLWTFINPLLQLIVYSFVFSAILRSNIEKYYLFLFVALIPWIFFSSALTTGSMAVVSQTSMVQKIYFPREVLPIAYVTSSFVNMLYCFIVVFIVILFSRIAVNPVALLFLPAVWAIEYVMALAVGMIVSAVTVYFRDLEHIFGILAMAWQFLTPIMYPIEIVPDQYLAVFNLNPMTPVISVYRDILYYGRIPRLGTLGQAAIFGTTLLAAAFVVFGRLKRHFAEEL